MSHNANKTYNIQHDDCYFTTGRSFDKQFLIGFQLPNLILLTFDMRGIFIDLSLKNIAIETQSLIQIDAIVDDNEITSGMKDWAEQLQIVTGTISIKKFFVPEYWVGIKDLPDHYQDVLDNPNDYKSELDDLYVEINEWQSRGDYVLWWNDEYYMSQEGEVIST